MSHMFTNCKMLKELMVSSHFITPNVTDMSYMFKECSILNDLNVTKFDINKNARMNHMFAFCNDFFIKRIKNKNKDINDEAFQNDYFLFQK